MSDAVLVTGATGFIGRALVGRLQESGRKTIALGSSDGDICDVQTLRKLSSDRIAHVVHLAGRTYVPESWTDPQGFVRTNVLGTFNVLELCRETGAALTFLSAYLYGVPECLPISEDAPSHPNNPYALSKYMAEEACRFYVEKHGVAVTILRPFNVYGPGQDRRFLIPTIIAQLKGRRIEVKDLRPRRDYIHLDDVVEATLRATTCRTGYNIFNLGSGISHSVRDVIGIAQAAAGTGVPVVDRNEPRPDEIPDVVADIRRARKGLGWTPRISLDSGIKSLVRSELGGA